MHSQRHQSPCLLPENGLTIFGIPFFGILQLFVPISYVPIYTQKTVVVLDNAPIHHSEEFENQMAIWQEKDLYIFFLPTYSPHLNLIETLWRKSKYEWLKPHHYQSFEILTQAVENILTNLAKEFKIDFSELKHFIDCKTSFNFS